MQINPTGDASVSSYSHAQNVQLSSRAHSGIHAPASLETEGAVSTHSADPELINRLSDMSTLQHAFLEAMKTGDRIMGHSLLEIIR